jgi:hypothetical protein
MEAYQGIKRIKDILSGAGIKGRIKVGPELIGIGSVLNIAYNAESTRVISLFSMEFVAAITDSMHLPINLSSFLDIITTDKCIFLCCDIISPLCE